jgi:hypothetical protein
VSNSLKDFKDAFRASLPSGVTFDSDVSRYFYNDKRFVTEKEVEWYRNYILKNGGSVLAYTAAYAANSIDPELVADFASDFYAQDSAASTFGDLLTFSRASSATYVDSSGVLQTASSGVARTAHHKWNGSAWVNKGLLLESKARTNLITYSEDFTDASWADSNTATLAVDATGPDGETSAVTLVDSGAGGTGQVRVFQGFTVSASTGYTHSVFAKADQLDYIALRTLGFSSGNGISVFNLSAGTISEKDVSHDAATIENYGNGWYRCSVTFTTDSVDTTGSIAIHVLEDESASISDTNLDGTSSILIYGAQFEEGSTPSSYIPTSGATVTRAAETLSIAGAKMPSYTTAVSIAMAGEVSFGIDNTTQTVICLDWEKAFNQRVNFGVRTDGANNGAFNFVLDARGAGGNIASVGQASSAFAAAANKPFNVAARYGSTFINGAVDGAALTANTTQTAIPELSTDDSQIGTSYMGTIEKAIVWGADIGDTGIEEASA